MISLSLLVDKERHAHLNLELMNDCVHEYVYSFNHRFQFKRKSIRKLDFVTTRRLSIYKCMKCGKGELRTPTEKDYQESYSKHLR